MPNLIEILPDFARKIVETLSVFAPGVPPTAVGGALIAWFRHEQAKAERKRQEELQARADTDKSREARIEADAKAEGAARAGVDAAADAQIKRLESECIRKDLKIAALEADRNDGWRGLNNATLRWTQANHDSDNNETLLILRLERAGGEVPKLRSREPVPDVQVLAGRIPPPEKKTPPE